MYLPEHFKKEIIRLRDQIISSTASKSGGTLKASVSFHAKNHKKEGIDLSGYDLFIEVRDSRTKALRVHKIFTVGEIVYAEIGSVGFESIAVRTREVSIHPNISLHEILGYMKAWAFEKKYELTSDEQGLVFGWLMHKNPSQGFSAESEAMLKARLMRDLMFYKNKPDCEDIVAKIIFQLLPY